MRVEYDLRNMTRGKYAGKRINIVGAVNRRKNPLTPAQFAICLRADEPELLTLRKLYEVIPDQSAAEYGQIRVIDETGEFNLFPVEDFVLIRLPREVEEILTAA